MAVQGLSAELSVDASDYIAGLEVAEQQTEELGDEAARVSRQMTLMQGRVDEAGDEMTELAGKSTVAGVALNGLSSSASRSSLSLSGLLASTVGVTGALGTLTAVALGASAAVAAVGAAVISLAGIGGLLIGAGLVTSFERLKTVASDVATEIKRALAPLGRTIGPLLVDALRAIPTLIRRIVNSIGGVQQFKNALQDLGAIAMQTIPPLVGAMADFARAVLPALRRVTAFIGGSGASAFRMLQGTFTRIADEVGRLLGAIIGLLPTLIRFGATIVETFGPALTLTVTLLDGFLEGVNALVSLIPSQLIPVIKVLGAVLIGTLVAASLTPASLAIAGVVLAIGALVKVFKTLQPQLAKIAKKLQPVIETLRLVGQFAMFAAQAIAQLAAVSGLGGPGARVQAAAMAAGGSSLPTADATAGTGLRRRRRNEAQRGNPGARDGGGLPPIEVQGDTGVVKDVAWQSADDRISREERRSRGLNRRGA